MSRHASIRFFAAYATLGVGLAAAVMWVDRGWLSHQPDVVRIQQAPATGERAPGPDSYAGAVQQASSAVVNIYTSKRDSEPRHPFFDSPLFERFFEERHPGRPRPETSLGSGVLMSDSGHILTNHHVIEDATAIQVRLVDGRQAGAAVVGTDPATDLAVLRIGIRPVPNVTTGNSRSLAVGDVVLAIGNPFGVGQTVTQGIVSATGRSQLGLATFEDFIQTDAAINPGNSGGALINSNGELIGINTAIYSRSGGSMGIGFAIPAHLAQDVMSDIIEDGQVARGWLGLQVQRVTRQLAAEAQLESPGGVLVASVYPSGPADEAGLRSGDIIRTLGGEPVRGPRQLRRRVAELEPGEVVSVTARRDDRTTKHRIQLSQRRVPGGR